MRAVLVEGAFRADLLIRAVLLDAACLTLGAGLFLWSFQVARKRGLLLQIGE